jgi:hypothetical protein
MAKKAKPKEDAIALDEWGFPLIITTEALCSITGVSNRRIHQLVADTRIPIDCKARDGYWNTTISLREIFGYYRRVADKAKPQKDKDVESLVSLEDLRSRRIKNAKLARELLPRHVYVQSWGEILTTFKNRWMSFGAKMGPRAFRAKDKVEASELIDAEVNDIFAGLADPKVMEDIAAKIRDDEFDTPNAERETADDLVAEDSEGISEGDTGVSDPPAET